MPDSAISYIKVDSRDNVAVITRNGGLPAGSKLDNGITLNVDIPQGHKVALTAFEPNDVVIRYGETIGYAMKALIPGDWVNENVLRMPDAPELDTLPIATRKIPLHEPLDSYYFEGYKNTDGSVGTKNVLSISTSVQCVSGVTEHAVKRIKQELLPKYPNVDDVVGLTHSYGCGVAINAPAAIIPIRTLQNIAKNPNFGGETLVIGLGCEKLRPQRLIPANKLNNNDSKADPIISLQDENHHGFSSMIEHIMQTAEAQLEKLNQRQRERCHASNLAVGMQCGGSDALSGLTANPAVGFATDLIVRAGGSVMFSEVTEVRDALHLLTPRVIDEETGQAMLREMQWFDDYLASGLADRSANTTPGNKSGGLSNIVEKAMGSIIKSGTSPIIDVIGPGERLRKKGLTYAATPASDFICGTLQLAAGMNMHVFTTGRGTPYGLSMVPVIKVASNSRLAQQWHDLIDIDAGRIATGQATIQDIGWEIFQMILDTASGRHQVAADRLGLHNDLVLFNPAPVT